jgi:ATP-dependent Clp protease ATP-binding subunit ClpC
MKVAFYPDVFNMLLQVLDDGLLMNLGEKVTLKHIIIAMLQTQRRQLKDFGQGVGFGTAAKSHKLMTILRASLKMP